jgi:putative DNA primase/helicase
MTRSDPAYESPASAIIKALDGNLRSGMCCCPAHENTQTPALHVSAAPDGRVLVHCFANCPQEKVIGKLKEMDLWNGGMGRPLTPAEQADAREQWSLDRDQRFHKAIEIMRAATEPPGKLRPYLEGRGIDAVPPAASMLKSLRARQLGLGFNSPVMVLPALGLARRDEDDQLPDKTLRILGAHLTFLTLKADANHKEVSGKKRRSARRVYGSFSGGFIPLSQLDEYTPDTPLIVAEGVETTLSAMQLTGLPGVALVSATNDVNVLPDCSKVIICPDNDNNNAGWEAALRLAGRLDAMGKPWHLSGPDGWRTAFNIPMRKSTMRSCSAENRGSERTLSWSL